MLNRKINYEKDFTLLKKN